MQFREHTLKNGLEIVAECNDQAYSTALAFFVKTGSRDETAEIAGVSHFLEHMVFKGTPRRSAADVNRELDEIGSHSNAFTSEEQTVYYATVLPEYQTAAVDLLADIMRPSLRQEDFDTEKKVILEEILKYEDQPPYGAHEKCMAAYFGEHPLGNSVLGTSQSVTNLTPEAMRAYFQSRYSPSNIAFVASGKIDFDELVNSLDERCGDWERFNAERNLVEAAVREEFHAIEKESSTQQYIITIGKAPSATNDDRYAQRVLAAIVGDDTGSRFYWELVDTGLAEYAGMGPYEFQGDGIMMSYICCSPEQVERNLQLAHGIQKSLELDGVTEDELELAVNKICSQLVRQSERPTSRMFTVGNGWLQRRTYSTVQDRLAKYRSVTRDDINRVLATYPLTQNTLVTVGPRDDISPLK